MPGMTDQFLEGVPAGVDPKDETLVALYRLIAQARDEAVPATSRITATVNARTYLESLTQRLVAEAREDGATWEEIGLLFGTSARNAQARFGDYRNYDD